MSNRDLVLSEQLRQIISNLLYFEMRDPKLEGITITRVKVSPDLQYADVRFTLMDDQKRADTVIQALNRAKGALKRAVGKRVKLRRTPELRFHLDEDVLRERRIGQILDELDIPEPENDQS